MTTTGVITIIDGTLVVQVPFADLQKLFDTAVNSMDFGSGFLDHDEVLMLRRIAVILGVDEMVATPEGFKKQFRHTYRPRMRTTYDWTVRDPYERGKTKHDEEVCEACWEYADFRMHHD
jgi:hypothetical protein